VRLGLGIDQLVVRPVEVGINTTRRLGSLALPYMASARRVVDSPSLGIHREANHFSDEVQTIAEDIKRNNDPDVASYHIQWLAFAVLRRFRETNQRGEPISSDYIAQVTSVMKEADIPFNIADEAVNMLPDLAKSIDSLSKPTTPSV